MRWCISCRSKAFFLGIHSYLGLAIWHEAGSPCLVHKIPPTKRGCGKMKLPLVFILVEITFSGKYFPSFVFCVMWKKTTKCIYWYDANLIYWIYIYLWNIIWWYQLTFKNNCKVTIMWLWDKYDQSYNAASKVCLT